MDGSNEKFHGIKLGGLLCFALISTQEHGQNYFIYRWFFINDHDILYH
jgi:hypothetical protein